MFYSGDFDPWQIVLQIAVMQAGFYLALGLLTSLAALFFQTPVSLALVLSARQLNTALPHGWTAIAILLLAAPLVAVLLRFVVQRWKKCLDFTVTLYLFHLLLALAYDRFAAAPAMAFWYAWVLSAIVADVLGELLCAKHEAEPIAFDNGGYAPVAADAGGLAAAAPAASSNSTSSSSSSLISRASLGGGIGAGGTGPGGAGSGSKRASPTLSPTSSLSLSPLSSPGSPAASTLASLVASSSSSPTAAAAAAANGLDAHLSRTALLASTGGNGLPFFPAPSALAAQSTFPSGSVARAPSRSSPRLSAQTPFGLASALLTSEQAATGGSGLVTSASHRARLLPLPAASGVDSGARARSGGADSDTEDTGFP